MKKLLIPVLIVLAIGLVFIYIARGFPTRINTDFATKVSLRYHYPNKSIDTVITDTNDVKALKKLFAGPVYRDGGLSCGFSPDVSITLSDGQKKIVFCPACDTCGNIRIYGSDRYVKLSDKQRKRFDTIVKKYGMTFPCE
ncbi:MAG: hypothetical protein ABFD46_00155 [Armatimonadota bacterium]